MGGPDVEMIRREVGPKAATLAAHYTPPDVRFRQNVLAMSAAACPGRWKDLGALLAEGKRLLRVMERNGISEEGA